MEMRVNFLKIFNPIWLYRILFCSLELFVQKWPILDVEKKVAELFEIG